MDVGKGENDLTIQSPGHLTQHLSPDRIAVLESIPGEAPSRVLMVQEIHESIRRLASRFVCPPARKGSLEEPLDGLGQGIEMACGGRSDRRRHVAVEHEVIREYHAISGGYRAHLMMAVSVEGDERQLPAGSPEGDVLVVVLDHHRAARDGGRQDHDQRPNHVVALFGVLVGGEELPGPVDEHVVKLRLDVCAVRESEVAPHTIEHRPKRTAPSPLVDPDAGLRNFEGVPYTWIESRLVLQAIPSRTRSRTQPPRCRPRDRPPDSAHPLHFELQVVRGRGAARGERAGCFNAREQLACIL